MSDWMRFFSPLDLALFLLSALGWVAGGWLLVRRGVQAVPEPILHRYSYHLATTLTLSAQIGLTSILAT